MAGDDTNSPAYLTREEAEEAAEEYIEAFEDYERGEVSVTRKSRAQREEELSEYYGSLMFAAINDSTRPGYVSVERSSRKRWLGIF
jgi:hypothetical protein